MQSPPGPETVIDGRRYLYFGGTGYLGLQSHPEVIRAACEAAQRYGTGSATSRSGFGNTPPVLDVERQAARFFDMEEAFYFMSGYVGSHILVQCLAGQFDAVFIDELSHYCVDEAARLGDRPIFRFRHCDAEHLQSLLRVNLAPGHRPLVMTDGVFAARGTIAPLVEYRAVAGAYQGAKILVDDAHGIGVLGAGGRGTVELLGLFDARVNAMVPGDERVPTMPSLFVCGTLSKAIGGYGGILPGATQFVDFVKANSTYYGGASPPPAPIAAGTAKAIQLAADPALRLRLRENVHKVKDGLRQLGIQTDDSPVPIVCLKLGTVEEMQQLEQALAERGIVVPYMPAYAGLPPGGAMRLAVFATHTDPMIQRLIDTLRQLL
jgi:7-keto-8-aminopelargonate synthetase-like enzyme